MNELVLLHLTSKLAIYMDRLNKDDGEHNINNDGRPSFNPFLTPEADKYWEKLDKEGTPVTKEELLDRIRRAQRNKGKKGD